MAGRLVLEGVHASYTEGGCACGGGAEAGRADGAGLVGGRAFRDGE